MTAKKPPEERKDKLPPEVVAVWTRLEGWTYERIARMVGISARSIQRMVASPEVSALLASSEEDKPTAQAAARTRAREMLPEVMAWIEEVGRDDAQSGAIRLKAAEIALKLAGAFVGERVKGPPVAIPATALEEAEQVYRDVVDALRQAEGNPAAVAALISRREDAYRAVQVERERGRDTGELTEAQVEALAQAAPDRLVWLWVEEWQRRHPDWVEAQRDALPAVASG